MPGPRGERLMYGKLTPWLTVVILFLPGPGIAADFPKFRAQEIDPHVGNVCYAVTTADVDGDGKPDAVAVAEDAVYWYANPSWAKHTIIKNATERDNVCIQPHDIDGDGKVDFALGRLAGSRRTRRPAARSSGSSAATEGRSRRGRSCRSAPSRPFTGCAGAT